jgi:colanic acid biosynthesis glycosyl transferase WcaI
MSIVFVNRYFHPDLSATSQLLSDLAFTLPDPKRSVHIVTSRQLYDKPGAWLPSLELLNEVLVHRVWTTRFGRATLIGRSIDYITFYISAGFALMRLLRPGDVVIAKTDPPMISVVAWICAKLRRALLINWLQDLFPEIVTTLRPGFAARVIAKPLARLRDASLRAAFTNVVVGESMEAFLRERGGSPIRVTVIHNWADGSAIRPIPTETSALRREWSLQDRFVVAYSGNLGRVHDHSTLLDSAVALGGDRRMVFLFVGQGHGFRMLAEEATRRGVANMMFKDHQPRARLLHSLAAGDVHLVSLATGMGRFVVPSKFYGILASGRPVLFVGDPGSEIVSLLRKYECGFAVESGDYRGLARIVQRLATDVELRSRLGANARALFEGRFAQPIALDAWESLIDAAASGAWAMKVRGEK